MNRIQQLFLEKKQAKKKALIPYITAGDPNLKTTEAIVKTLAANGADLIELGIPFTDSIADGPVIQSAFLRAFASHTTPQSILTLVKEIRKYSQIPICLMTSINIPYRIGYKTFFCEARNAGVDGFILPDLSQEEAPPVARLLSTYHLAFIPLVAPTSSKARIQRCSQLATGFLYLVSRTGTTGVQKTLAKEAVQLIRSVQKEAPHTPQAVGFGISTPEQASILAASGTDGVIIGSRIITLLEQAKNQKDAMRKVGTFIRRVRHALDQQ